MKTEELTPGARVRVKEGHPSGYGCRTGRIIAVEVTVDIGEPLLIRIEPEHLEPAPEDPLAPGWGEFEV